MRRWLVVGVFALGACGSEEPEVPAPDVPAPVVEAPAPEPAPTDFLEVDADTVSAALREHDADVLLVNVWSTWCEPCVEELPAMIGFAREREARGLGLALIAVEAPANREAAWALLDEHDAPQPRYFQTGSQDAFIGELHEDWTGALPATLLLDRQRRVVRFWGEPVTPDDLREPVDALLGDTT